MKKLETDYLFKRKKILEKNSQSDWYKLENEMNCSQLNQQF